MQITSPQRYCPLDFRVPGRRFVSLRAAVGFFPLAEANLIRRAGFRSPRAIAPASRILLTSSPNNLRFN